MNFVYLVIGFILLIKGADWLVVSASKLAKSFGVPTLIIGLSVVAFGTSAPESAVGIFSGIKHTNQITLGDVTGSSIANVALIIGITALLAPLAVDKSIIKKEIPMSLGIQVLFFILAAIGSILSRFDGILLIIVFAIFLFYLWYSAKHTHLDIIELDETQKCDNPEEAVSNQIDIKYRLKLVLFLLIGLAGLILGGNLVVDSSVGIAHTFGLSEALIGVTIVALGTSLPELVTCVLATLRKECDIAVGNIIGSNIFNILFVLGLSSIIYPIPVIGGAYIDMIVMLLSTILLFGLAVSKKTVTRFGGAILVVFYITFILYKVFTI